MPDYVQIKGGSCTGEVFDKKGECDICGRENLKTLIDGCTVDGLWGILCILCHGLYGRGLGIGNGQLYSHKSTMNEVRND